MPDKATKWRGEIFFFEIIIILYLLMKQEQYIV